MTKRRAFLFVVALLWAAAAWGAQGDPAVEFIQLTDTHVVNVAGVAPQLAAERNHFTSPADLGRFLSDVAPKYKPAFAIVTGDLTDSFTFEGGDGKPVGGQIETFSRIYDASPIPLFLLLGNHDLHHYALNPKTKKPAPDQSVAGEARAAWIIAAKCFQRGTYYSFERQVGSARFLFLMLDNGYSGSGSEEKSEFRMAAEQLQWIRRQLDLHPGEGVIVAMHVPLADDPASAAAKAALGRSPNILAVIAGHKHSDAIEEVELGASRTIQVRTAAFGYGTQNWRRMRLTPDRIDIYATGKPDVVEKTIPVRRRADVQRPRIRAGGDARAPRRYNAVRGDSSMPTYLLLMNATPEGTRKISEVGSRYENFKKELKKAGGRLIGAYALLGGHDYAATIEMPSEQELVRLSLGIAQRGASQVQSYRAFPMDEFVKLTQDL